MKLQIIKLGFTDKVLGNWLYRYLLELDERLLAYTDKTSEKMDKDKAYDTLTRILLDKGIDTNLEHYKKITQIAGLAWNILLEQEVTDHYLKDLKIQQRIKDLEGDFS